MRYGNPSVGSAIDALAAKGCDRILFVPLYPQYAAATTATACDAVFRHLMTMRWQPTLRVAPPYHDDPVYIDALASSIRDELAKLPFKPDVILASFHGIPRDYFDKGDPYYCHCAKTARLLREALGYDEQAFPPDLPVALRPGGMAAALYRQDGGGAGAKRGEESRDRDARLFRRLPGDAGGDRGREWRYLQGCTAGRISPPSPA